MIVRMAVMDWIIPPFTTFPICSMYGIFTYIWVILFGQMLLKIFQHHGAYGFGTGFMC